ncbi:nose resistant to fluoxetine protein 6-like [Spodoptera frugiperda]|uniref:Nose resistant to fluoxetine protein 6-like n=2 Tax=Spodoptera frugiperda TaxID=7108 RepID=A0A9R0F3X8_SPOFR|nr:nose resistant to fluoxetine protein 6-like [Spodoptera frugiperda]
MKLLVLLFLITVLKNGCFVNAHLDMVVPDHKNVFDLNLYESVLDPELCEKQLNHMLDNDQELLFEFFDAGIRTPRGILTGGVLDLGNYHQCLGIRKQIPSSVVEGKYCMINVPLDQDWPSLPTTPSLPDITWPDITWPPQNQRYLKWRENVAKKSSELRVAMAGYDSFSGATNESSSALAALTFRLGVCIPKACTPRSAINSIFGGLNTSPIEFEESYCRLPKDKHWVAGDYVALVIFGIFILLVAISTAYDIRHNIFLQKDPKKINKLWVAFSAYTNTRRLVTYTPVPGTLECLDGIRSFAMMWVIIGHTFVTQTQSQIMGNPADALAWMTSLQSVWITAAPITVDTFFTLSGLLLVYTTAGKLTSLKLLKNLHLFYLNRLLRMFPVLAAVILMQISIFNRVADGPYWNVEMTNTHRCRVYWWSTLLHIQNYVNPSHMCLSHSWYLAIDVQLHILSPIVLVWILTGKRKLAWSALVGSLIAVLAAATTYNFIKEFQSGPVIPSRPYDTPDYLINYYVNTLTRASPFFVGLIFGYILHLNRGTKVVINFWSATVMWVCTTVIALLIIYSSYPIMQLDWKNQFADSMINSFMRPAWAMFIGWMIFACEHGYGGPVNWVLCLRAWKVLGRLSYAMYLVHYPLMFVVLAMPIVPIYFDVQFSLYNFFADFLLAVIVAFIVTILIDSPCSVLIKHFMGGGPRRPPQKVAPALEPEMVEKEMKTQL